MPDHECNWLTFADQVGVSAAQNVLHVLQLVTAISLTTIRRVRLCLVRVQRHQGAYHCPGSTTALADTCEGPSWKISSPALSVSRCHNIRRRRDGRITFAERERELNDAEGDRLFEQHDSAGSVVCLLIPVECIVEGMGCDIGHKGHMPYIIRFVLSPGTLPCAR